jgi:hypothetical protein
MMPRAIVRADQLRIPRLISEKDFTEICEIYHIPIDTRKHLKQRLDELIHALSEVMKRREPQRSSDRQRLRGALSAIERAADQIDKLGQNGRRALAAVSDALGPMLSAEWINRKFPDDAYAPQRSRPSSRARSSYRDPTYFIEEDTRASRWEFVRRRPSQTTLAVLRALAPGLEDALDALNLQPGAKGGRQRLVRRHEFIINLAEFWSEVGLRISVSATSDFTSFCEAVAVSVGWPNDGMDSAVSKAVRDWRNLPRKRSGLRK